MTNVNKLGYEFLPVVPEPDPSAQHANINDRMGVYELVDAKEGDDEVFEEFRRVVWKFDDKTQVATKKTKEMNLGTEERPKQVQISVCLEPDEESKILEVLREYQDVFASDYNDMPGLAPDLVEHRIPLEENARRIK